MSLRNQPLSQALNPRRGSIAPTLLLTLGMLLSAGAAIYGFLESRRTERVVIAVRPVPYGQRITAEDLGVVELPLHRPAQLAGIGSLDAAAGRWAAREIGPNDLLQPAMLLDAPPSQPVYPNGRRLARDAVPLPFAVESIGPLTDRDRVNIGFTADDPSLCRGDGPGSAGRGGARAYACRFLTGLSVLYIESDVAYLEVTPYQAHAVWALQAAGVQLWGERYGAASAPLEAVVPLDAGRIDLARLTARPEEGKTEGSAETVTPTATPAAPGSGPLPGAARP
ncbi:MAG: hypothetical protein RLZZ387_1610 [Chloroflexota bacterium]|jgi:hypothetical protein